MADSIHMKIFNAFHLTHFKDRTGLQKFNKRSQHSVLITTGGDLSSTGKYLP